MVKLLAHVQWTAMRIVLTYFAEYNMQYPTRYGQIGLHLILDNKTMRLFNFNNENLLQQRVGFKIFQFSYPNREVSFTCRRHLQSNHVYDDVIN